MSESLLNRLVFFVFYRRFVKRVLSLDIAAVAGPGITWPFAGLALIAAAWSMTPVGLLIFAATIAVLLVRCDKLQKAAGAAGAGAGAGDGLERFHRTASGACPGA